MNTEQRQVAANLWTKPTIAIYYYSARKLMHILP